MTEKITLTRPGARPLEFVGEQIAHATSEAVNERTKNRWHELTIWRTIQPGSSSRMIFSKIAVSLKPVAFVNAANIATTSGANRYPLRFSLRAMFPQFPSHYSTIPASCTYKKQARSK